MDWEQFVKSLRQAKPAGVYLLTGDDRYLKTKALEQLKTAIFPKGKGDVIRYQAPEGIQNAAQDLQTYPFFSGMRLIILENAESITADARSALQPILEDPSPFAVLALIAGEEADGKGWPKWVTKHATQIACSASPAQLRRWVQGWLKKQGLRLHPQALASLVERSGGKFGSLIPELEKLSLLCPPGGTVTREMVESSCLDHSEEEIFALTGALLTRDRGRGVQALEHLLAQGQPPGHIVTMLSKSLKLRWALTDVSTQRNDTEIAAAMRLSPRWVDFARRRGEKATPEVARRLWDALDQADQRLKTSAHNESLILLASVTPGFSPSRQNAEPFTTNKQAR